MEGPKTVIIYQLLRKLKTQGDISVKEADQIRSFMKDVYEFMFRMEQEIYGPNAEAMTSWDARKLLYEQFPVAALQDWYKAVARQIEKGQSGNFIFSIPIDREMLLRQKCTSALEVLEKYGKPEDRMEAIFVNPKVHSLFQNIFGTCSPGKGLISTVACIQYVGNTLGSFAGPYVIPKAVKLTLYRR